MKLFKITLLFVLYHFFTVPLVSKTAFADDELYLCGAVKEVNTGERKVSIEVVSEGCTGKKIFKVSISQDINKFIVNDDTCFTINMNTCPQTQTAIIIAK